VASSVPAPTNPSTRGNRSTRSHIQFILRKNYVSSSTFIPRATSSEIQIFANSTSEYGNISFDDENFSILQYWHQVKGVFPILASMAYDIFTIPVSTLASESYFSASNRVLNDKKNKIGENVFEALVLLNDWYDTENRLQDKSWMHSLDREEGTVASSSNLGEGMSEPEVNQN